MQTVGALLREPLMPASLIACGVPTGRGSSVHAADVQLGGTAVVFGTAGR